MAAARGAIPLPPPVALQGPALADPPAGAYVFEAEYFSESNFGWEAHVDPASGGGAYFFHCKEGIANNSAMTTFGVGEFLRCPFQAL